MASWKTNFKHEPSSINGGNQYEAKDRLSSENLNAITENAFYAMAKSDDAKAESSSAISIANEALAQSQKTGTQVNVDGLFQNSIDFTSDPQTQLNNKADKDLSNVTVDIEKIDVIYDKLSNNADINWGYTSGIKGGTSITNKDFSKYKRLKFYIKAGNYTVSSVFEMQFENKSTWGGYYIVYSFGNAFQLSTSGTETQWFSCSVAEDKTTLAPQFGSASNYKGKNNNSAFFISKIEGVY